jgi:hypothetical protein
LVGVAVKVVEALVQIEVVGVLMVTDGVTDPVMVMVSELDVAVVGEAQVAVEVMTHVTTAPVVRVVVV